MPDEIGQGDPAPPDRARPGFDRNQVTGGLILIAIGLLLVVGNTQNVGRVIPLGIGVVLLVGFLITRRYAFLVPGCIVTGVGVGTLLVSDDPTGTQGPLFLLALGLGFVAVWAFGLLFRLPEQHWWPLIPGGILTGIGALTLIGPGNQRILDYWPVVLIVLGVVLLGRAYSGRTRP